LLHLSREIYYLFFSPWLFIISNESLRPKWFSFRNIQGHI
jgi:hypothetical protein